MHGGGERADPLAYYSEQSRITDPGRHSHLLEDLPRDIAELCRVVQGLVVHYRLGHLFDYEIPDERLPERRPLRGDDAGSHRGA